MWLGNRDYDWVTGGYDWKTRGYGWVTGGCDWVTGGYECKTVNVPHAKDWIW